MSHSGGSECPHCERTTRRGEGPAAGLSFVFSATEAARALVLLGEGRSLRETGQKVRYSADRYKTDSGGMRRASRDPALAADYLDHLGPAVVRALTPPRWPRVLVLDSTPLNLYARGADAFGYERARRGGAVLVAAGRGRAQGRTRCWLAGLAGDETADSWFEFLGQLGDDPPPFWVVADGSKAIRNAVEARWPEAIFYPCEHHLRERAMKHAADDGALDVPGLVEAIERAFWGIETWERLGALITQALGPSNLLSWWLRNDPDAREMVVAKHRFGDYPNANGPAERVAFEIRERVKDRVQNFGNAGRLATLIGLMGIDLAEQADDVRYARVLREHLSGRDWALRADWEAGHDQSGWGHTSLAEMLMAAWEREAASSRAATTGSIAASFGRRLAVVSLLHERAGLPAPAVANPQAAQPSIAVRGMTLAEFPLLLAEWDRDANPDVADPALLPAGSGKRANWVCAKGHRWPAAVVQRTARATGCRVCFRAWATVETSIAGVHPALVSEWDASNHRRRPEAVKTTSRLSAVWKCADPSHAAYAMSPAARCRRAAAGRPGCPLCARAARAAEKAARKAARQAPSSGGG